MKKILLIEDNADVRENTSEILTLANYEVITAEDGKMGVDMAREFMPDLIICDIMMPKMDGYEVLRLLGADRSMGSKPFIFLSAKTDRADMRFGMNLGADDYVSKPFEENELLGAIACRMKKNDFLRKEITRNIGGIHSFLNEASEYIDMTSLSKDYRLKGYDKKDFVFWEGTNAHSLYLIESGTVKTYKSTETGKELVTGICGAGDFIGQLSLLNLAGKYIENAVVLEDAQICTIPKADFIKLLYENQLVAQKFISMISNNFIDIQTQLVDMAFASVRQRAAKVLLQLYNKGIITDGTSEGLGVPREDFAGMIGTATETAIRTLSNFKEDRLITSDSGRRIILLDKGKLRNIAEFG